VGTLNNVKLSSDQDKAYDDIFSTPIKDSKSQFFFLTGEAGTGKTTLVNHIKSHHESRLTASTGAASQLIGGTTVYRFLGIRPKNVMKNIPPKDEVVDRRIGESEVVFIDEVSMIDTSLFNLIHDSLANKGLRVVFVGDFFQLPPVKGMYCCMHPKWNFVRPLLLTVNHRQGSDKEFAEALSSLRWGVITPYLADLAKKWKVEELPEDCVNIMPHRDVVERTNNKRLEALGNEIFTFNCKIDHMHKSLTEDSALRLIDSGRIPASIRLCEGARVVFVTNDNDNKWVNGTLGTVTKVSKASVIVKADKGGLITVPFATHEISDADGGLLIRYTQIPLNLAWAMTIHKFQGTTAEKIGIQLGNHFGAGMTYVALSRCKSPENIFVTGDLTKALADPRIVQLYRNYYGV